jgi:hypothetical protein
MTTDRLRLYNVLMGGLHAIQGFVVLLIANEFALPVTATFMTDAPGAAPPELRTLFEVRFAWWVAAFLFVSAAAHWNLQRERNYARWIEYSVSSSIMVVLIAMLTGISEVTAIGALFAVNAAMILFGLLQEHYESPGNGRWMPYWMGVFAGAVPWILIGVYLWSPGVAAEPPAFVYAIFITLFIFFNSFAVNMVLQYRKVGRWADYLYGEKVYVFLSLTAKSLLAWQVFGGTLAS